MARILFLLSLCLLAGLSTAIDDKCNKHTAKTQIFPNARIDQVVWCKPDYQVAFLTLSDQSLYRTEDTGRTWTKVSKVTARSVTATADDSKYFFLDSNGTLSVTTDKGRTVTTYSQHRDLAEIEPHPTKADWALASRRVCNNPNGFWSCHTNLLVTQDFGATWSFVNGNVNQYTWGNAGKSGIPDTNIHYVWYPYSNDTDDESEFGTYARSPDLGKTVTHSIPNCVGMLFTPEFFFVAQDIGNDLVLMTSDSNANTFQTARFPQVIELNLKQTRYSILDTTGGAAFINVDHSNDGRWGHTYVADSFSDPSFVVSMKYTKRSPSGRVDFARVKGVDGVYIANKWLVDDADRSIKPETMLQTFITYNSGATWQRLTVPKGSGCNDCPLNLVGRANVYNIPSFYTSARAVGLVIAAGSIEDSIDDVLPDELQTFFSRDAGQSWELIKNGTHLYHFLDHGSIIVLLDSQTKTNTYSYTWNEGLAWHDCVLSSTTFDVKSIQSAPTGTALSLLVVGELENTNGKRSGVLVHLDFSDLHSTVCGPDDYETFSPHGDQCLLGQKFTYKRRQRAKECFNGDAYEASSTPEACPCTEADYECEFCFERSANGTCVLQPVSLCQRLKNQPCHTGYRLAPRNKCNPDAPKAVNHLPDKSCNPNTNPKSKSGGSRVAIIVVIMVLLAIVGILIGGTLYLRKTNENFRDKTDAFFEKISSIFKKPSGRVAHYSAVNKHEGDDLLDDEDVDGPKELDDDAISRYTNKKPTATQPKSGERDEFI